MEFPRERNSQLQAALDERYPFRPVKEKMVERYGLTNEEP
jgi:hypothetical protein